MNAPAPKNQELINFIENEVCIVLEGPETAGSPDSMNYLYDEVLARLNGELRGLPSDGPVPMLAPLTRAAVGTDRFSTPWVVFPDGQERATFFHFYEIGAPDSASPDQRVNVLTLVNAINAQLLNVPVESTGMVHLTAASPHWLSAAGQLPHSGSGPGTAPQAVPPTTAVDPRFSAAPTVPNTIKDEVNRLLSGQGVQENIPVVILDSCPLLQDVRKAKSQFPANPLLADVADNVEIDEPPSLPRAYFHHLQHAFPQWHGEAHRQVPPGTRHLGMPDHGLFVAGIIRTIAPKARIHLLRVLDDTGVGDLLALLICLRQIPAAFLGGDAGHGPLVVNLSLMIDIPTAEDIEEQLFQGAATDPAQRAEVDTAMIEMIALINTKIGAAIDWLQQHDILVVAAAGNDALARPVHPEPRLPARYDAVLGVAAVNRAQNAATFSNRGDAPAIGNGLAVFGGDATTPIPAAEAPRIPMHNGKPDAIVGICSSTRLVPDAATNHTGWVYWAGTSFATPVITGMAANYWGSPGQSGATPGQVIDYMEGLTSTNEPTLNCQAIEVAQN